MSPHGWRRVLLTLCAFAILESALTEWIQETHFGAMPGFAVSFFGPAATGDSVKRLPTATPDVYRLTFPPSNPIARAGVRSGDLLDLRAASKTQRYRWATEFWWAGERFPATLIRGGSVEHVTLTAQWLPLTWYARLATAGILWMLFFAGILAWRRPENPEARTLALLLIVSIIGLGFESQNWVTPWPALDIVLEILSGPIYAAGIVLLATYAMLFARPANGLRRVLARLSYAGAVTSGLVWALWPFAVVFRLPLGGSLSRLQQADIASAIAFSFPLLCFLAAIPQTRGAERARISWAALSLVPYYAIYVLPGSIFDDASLTVLLYFANVVLFVAPLGLTYSLLNRRLLDIDFALNRAAVFAATSLLLAGLFAGLQWIANAFFTSLVHVHNVIVEMTIVVIVYYVIRLSRHATDTVVTRLFFAARDRRLHALGEMAAMVDAISDAAAIAPLTVDYLRTRAGIEAAVFLQGPAGEYVPAGDVVPPAMPIGRDELALVTLKSRRKAAVAPEWRELGVAFPMLVRGELRGILFCQPPGDGDFAPDEMLVLQQLANHMATDRDALLTDALRAEMAALRLEMAQLRANLVTPPMQDRVP